MATTRSSLRRNLLLLIFSPVLLAIAYCAVMLGFATVVHVTANPYWALGLGLLIIAGIYAYRHRAQVKNSIPTASNPILAAAQAYQEKSRNIIPTTPEFSAWVDSLPLLDRSQAESTGLACSWANSFSFRRFVLEGRGHSFVDFLADNLTKQEFYRWVDMSYAQPA